MGKTDRIEKSNKNYSDEIFFKDITLKAHNLKRYLISKGITIIVASLICAFIGFTYAYLKKTIYSARLSFALEDDKGGGLSGALGLASQFGIDLGGSNGGAFSGDNLLELMRSRSMVEKTLLSKVNVTGKAQTLAELYIDFNKLRDKWKPKEGLQNIHFLPNTDRATFTLKQDSLLGEFHKEITKNQLIVDKVDKKMSIITVSVNSKNELFAKYFAEILVNNVSEFYINTKTKRTAQNVAILQHQTDSVRSELNAAISGVATSTDVNPNPNPNRQILRTPSQRRQVDVQANTAILTELVKNLEITKVTLRKETPLIQIIDEPILPLEKSKNNILVFTIVGAFLGVFMAIFCLLFFKPIANILIKSF